MSANGSRDFPNPTDPNDALHYAPRLVRGGASAQTRPVRLASSRAGLDEVSEPIAKSRRHPLDPEIVPQPEQPRTRFGLASRLTAAIGVAAIIGVIFFMMTPKSQGSDPAAVGAAKVSEEDSQALLHKFVQFEKSQEDPSAGAAQGAPDDSKVLLQKFMQWQQKKQ